MKRFCLSIIIVVTTCLQLAAQNNIITGERKDSVADVTLRNSDTSVKKKPGVLSNFEETNINTANFSVSEFSSFEADILSFEKAKHNLDAVTKATINWVDIDNDDDLDLMLTGTAQSGGESDIARIYLNQLENNERGFSNIYNIPRDSSKYDLGVDWGDFDLDGHLDLFLAGGGSSDLFLNKSSENKMSFLLHEVTTSPDLYVVNGSAEWGDYDQDGDLDLLIAGASSEKTSAFSTTVILQNTEGRFNTTEYNLKGLSRGSANWGDYDRDGDLDLIVSGAEGDFTKSQFSSIVYRNEGSQFKAVQSLAPTWLSTTEWGDINNDGYLDILLAGRSSYANPEDQLKVYKYDPQENLFKEVILAGARGTYTYGSESSQWGDIDNNGWLDVVAIESDGLVVYLNKKNDSFERQVISELVYYSSQNVVSCADYDNDGDLDIIVAVKDERDTRYTWILDNKINNSNKAPGKPANLQHNISGNKVTFSWGKASDDLTPPDGLSYDIIVYKKDEKGKISSYYTPCYANPENGKRKVVKSGSINGLSYTLKGLEDGEYYWSVQSVDHGFAGSEFASEKALLIGEPPSSPTNLRASEEKETSFTANWNEVSEAAKYEVDVSENSNFSSFVTGYHSKVVEGANSLTVTGLSAGKTYYFRVRAVSSSGIKSAYATTFSTITVPSAPTELSALNPTETSFTASWSSTQGAANYELDVSLSSTFSSFLEGYSEKAVQATSHDVLNLTPETTYYFRVRAVNANGKESGSSTLSVTTGTEAALSPPTNLRASDVNETSFTANWNEVSEAAKYEVDVSENSNFSSFITGYSSKVVEGTSSVAVTDLTPGNTYYFRVSAVNSSGIKSAYANSLPINTLSDTENKAPEIVSANFLLVKRYNLSEKGSLELIIKARDTDEHKISSAEITYAGLSQDFNTQATNEKLTQNGENYTFSFNFDQLDGLKDSLGIRYQVVFEDEAGMNADTTGVTYWLFGNSEVDLQRSGWKTIEGKKEPIVGDYNLIALPYESQSVQEALNFDKYDNQAWRLFRYSTEQKRFEEYNSSSFNSGSKFDPRRGYALIMRYGGGISFGGAIAEFNGFESDGTPSHHRIELRAGWNLIGNPYPFPIDWNQMEAVDEQNNPVNINSLPGLVRIVGQRYEESQTSLNSYEGAFLYHEKGGITIKLDPKIRLHSKQIPGGRLSAKKTEITNGWELPLIVEHAGFEYSRNGIGMRKEASHGWDIYDGVQLPKLSEYAELLISANTQVPLNRSVVPEQRTYVWNAEIAGALAGEQVSLQWDPTSVASLTHELFLWDETRGKLIAMKEQGQYSLVVADQATTPLKIYFGPKEELIRTLGLDQPQIGALFPNPTEGIVKLPLILPYVGAPFQLSIEVYNTQGQEISSFSRSGLEAGYQELELTLPESLREGLFHYFIHLQSSDKISTSLNGKILKW